MAEIDEKTREILGRLSESVHVRAEDSDHIEHQLQELADLKAALEWMHDPATSETGKELTFWYYPNSVQVAWDDGHGDIQRHDGTGSSIAAAIVRIHKESTDV